MSKILLCGNGINIQFNKNEYTLINFINMLTNEKELENYINKLSTQKDFIKFNKNIIELKQIIKNCKSKISNLSDIAQKTA